MDLKTTPPPASAPPRTAVAMVTLGPDSWTRRYSVARARVYAERHGYDFRQVSEPTPAGAGAAVVAGRTPHWEKLLVPKVFPDYDRWLIIDDDVLVNTRTAPPLPNLPAGTLGMVREPVPTQYPPPMDWLGNSGVLLLDRAAVDLLDAAYAVGEFKDIVPGYGDQPALNHVAWGQRRVAALDWRWNYILLADWLRTAHRQEYPWTKSVALARLARLTLFARLGAARLLQALRRPPGRGEGVMARLRDSYFVHLIWFRMGAGWVHRYLD